jgi:siroheme synthase
LLTASTINTIKTATVLLVDDQVSEAVVALAPPTARWCGLAGAHSTGRPPKPLLKK